MTWWEQGLLFVALFLAVLYCRPRRCPECGARAGTIHDDDCASRGDLQ